MRLPFLRPKDPAAPRARPAAAPLGDDALVQLARTRARQRLVGALVLLAVGVIGFPLLFETQPRPMSPDMPIEVMRPDGSAAPKAAQATPAKVLPLNLPPADAGVETAVTAAAAPPSAPVTASTAPTVSTASTTATASASAPTRPPSAAGQAQSTVAPVVLAAAPRVAASAVVPAAKASAAAPRVAASAPPRAAASAAQAVAAEAAASAPGPGRFVVQAGAYTEPTKLREARQKVERLGLKTYTQVIENDAGKRTRVRVGPFATRQEAEAVAAKVKATGLQVNVLTL